MIPHKQLSLSDIFKECENLLEEDKPAFLSLLENHINLDEIVPVSFRNHYYSWTGRPRSYPLDAMLWAFFIQKIFSIQRALKIFVRQCTIKSDRGNQCRFLWCSLWSVIVDTLFFSRTSIAADHVNVHTALIQKYKMLCRKLFRIILLFLPYFSCFLYIRSFLFACVNLLLF